jgi:hypothetical protein
MKDEHWLADEVKRLTAEVKQLLGHKEEADRHIATIAELRAEIEQLRANWRPERNSLVEEQLLNEVKEQLATCRELREYDRKEIYRLRAEIELVSK